MSVELDRRSRQCETMAIDDLLPRPAGSVAGSEGLRAADAIHLATALQLGVARTVFVTWDRRLAASALRLGLAVAPGNLG